MKKLLSINVVISIFCLLIGAIAYMCISHEVQKILTLVAIALTFISIGAIYVRLNQKRDKMASICSMLVGYTCSIFALEAVLSFLKNNSAGPSITLDIITIDMLLAVLGIIVCFSILIASQEKKNNKEDSYFSIYLASLPLGIGAVLGGTVYLIKKYF